MPRLRGEEYAHRAARAAQACLYRPCRRQQTALEEALNRCAELEALLFAFVWNRATYPLGKQLGKSEDEIADKTLETMEAAANMVDIPKVRERLLAARQRREKKGEVHTDEADKKDTEGHS